MIVLRGPWIISKEKMKSDDLKVIEIIDEELRKRKWNWNDLARESSVKYTTLQNWRDQRNLPSNIINLKKVANALGLPLHYLCYGREESLRNYSETIKLEKKEETIFLGITLNVCRENNSEHGY